MFDYCDEGVTSEDFHDNITEEYFKIIGDDPEPKKLSFQGILMVVYEKLLTPAKLI
jgi:hypothetical protein